jgi:hypothetical protein
MYKMNISIGSFKIRLETLILIALLLWILWGHLLCSCSRIGLMEGLEIMRKAKKEVDHKVAKKKEGMTNINEYSSTPMPYKLGDYSTPDTSSWDQPNLVVKPGETPDAGVKAIWDRPEQPVPLPEGELDIFATTPFKPECCPNTYSNSMGCACMTVPQYNYVRSRGGNNVPYSEY